MVEPTPTVIPIEDPKEQELEKMATILPSVTFDDALAAEALERAFRGEKQKVVEILTKICNAQRQMIRTPYKTRYGKDLEEELKKALGGELEDLAVALMQTPSKYDVLELHRAVKGLGTNEKLLIDILTPKTNEEMVAIRNTYYGTYKKPLEQALSEDTSGDFKKMLMVLIQAQRDESDLPDSRSNQEAANLLKSFDKKSGIEKFDAVRPLLVANPPTIARISEDFERLAGMPLEKGIEKHFSGDVKNLLLAVAALGKGKHRVYADQIYAATKGMGTKDKDLIRVIVSRSEVDLQLIALEYQAKYKKALGEVIREECKGAYREGLLSLLRGNKGL